MRLPALICAVLLPLPLLAQVDLRKTDAELAKEKARGLKVAILNLSSGSIPEKDRAGIDLIHLSNVLRNAASDAMPGLEPMTAESITALLESNGVTAESCEQICAVNLGKLVSADFVSDGKLSRAGEGGFRLSVEIYDTRSKRRLYGIEVVSATEDGLANGLRKQAGTFFAPLKDRIDAQVADARRDELRAARAAEDKERALAQARAAQEEKDKLARSDSERIRQDLARKESRGQLEAQPRVKFLRWTGWGLMAGSVLAAGGMGVALLDGQKRNAKISNGETSSVADLLGQSDQGQTSNKVAKVLAAASGALLVSSVVLLLTQKPLDDDELKKLDLQLALAPGSALLAGRF